MTLDLFTYKWSPDKYTFKRKEKERKKLPCLVAISFISFILIIKVERKKKKKKSPCLLAVLFHYLNHKTEVERKKKRKKITLSLNCFFKS